MAASYPLNDWLVDGPQREPADTRVRSGYPVWILVSVWRARGDSDADVIAEYALDPNEWQAAKNYYLAHQAEIDARRARNDQAGVALPGAILIEDFLSSDDASSPSAADDTEKA
ncbi:MAG: hypothetical protein ACHQ1E_10900 [Ktedonobacterales bacterium]|jgi:uncharacterized protein (DUF433 family)